MPPIHPTHLHKHTCTTPSSVSPSLSTLLSLLTSWEGGHHSPPPSHSCLSHSSPSPPACILYHAHGRGGRKLSCLSPASFYLPGEREVSSFASNACPFYASMTWHAFHACPAHTATCSLPHFSLPHLYLHTSMPLAYLLPSAFTTFFIPAPTLPSTPAFLLTLHCPAPACMPSCPAFAFTSTSCLEEGEERKRRRGEERRERREGGSELSLSSPLSPTAPVPVAWRQPFTLCMALLRGLPSPTMHSNLNRDHASSRRLYRRQMLPTSLLPLTTYYQTRRASAGAPAPPSLTRHVSGVSRQAACCGCRAGDPSRQRDDASSLSCTKHIYASIVFSEPPPI